MIGELHGIRLLNHRPNSRDFGYFENTHNIKGGPDTEFKIRILLRVMQLYQPKRCAAGDRARTLDLMEVHSRQALILLLQNEWGGTNTLRRSLIHKFTFTFD